MKTFDALIRELENEILRLKEASPMSAMNMATEETPITLSTPTSTSTGHGYAYITLVSDRPFICQAYFDDVDNFQVDHRSWVLAVFFPADGVATIVVQVADPTTAGGMFTDEMTLVASADVAVQIDYEEV